MGLLQPGSLRYWQYEGEKMTILFDAAADKEDLFYPPLGFLYTSTVVPSLSDELVKDEEESENKGVLLFDLYF